MVDYEVGSALSKSDGTILHSCGCCDREELEDLFGTSPSLYIKGETKKFCDDITDTNPGVPSPTASPTAASSPAPSSSFAPSATSCSKYEENYCGYDKSSGEASKVSICIKSTGKGKSHDSGDGDAYYMNKCEKIEKVDGYALGAALSSKKSGGSKALFSCGCCDRDDIEAAEGTDSFTIVEEDASFCGWEDEASVSPTPAPVRPVRKRGRKNKKRNRRKKKKA